MMELDLDKIEAAAKKATKGPWHTHHGPGGQDIHVAGRIVARVDIGYTCEADTAHMVASCPEVVLELVQRLRFAEAALTVQCKLIGEKNAQLHNLREQLKPCTAAADREAIRDILAKSLSPYAYICNRVWSAWSFGTMSVDDFSPAWEDAELLYEMADEVLAACNGQEIM